MPGLTRLSAPLRSAASPSGRARALAVAGGLLALAVAVALFTRYSLDDTLRRDEAIYTYGGQQLAHGVPVYVSIFDPKGPLAAMLAGGGVALADLLKADGVHTVRIVFLVTACLAVGAVYLLGLGLWRSPLAALTAAVVLTAFRGFAYDAIGGPDAKTPGIFVGVLAMALLVRRRWFWGAFAGALAALVWQPLVVYVLVAVVAAATSARRGDRRRDIGLAVAGAAVPVLAVVAYFAIAGALPQFVEAAVRFPLTGVYRPPRTVGYRIGLIFSVVHGGYGKIGAVLLWGGLVALAAGLVLRLARTRGAALRDPYATVVVLSFIGLAAFSLHDFQGYPDVYPLLPYGAVGFGEAVFVARALLSRRPPRLATAAVVAAALAAVIAVSWASYSTPSLRRTALVRERADVREIQRMAGGRRLYALGDPTPLVLSAQRNPSRYIYLGSGVADWAVHHHFGSKAAWHRSIRAAHPGAITLAGWSLDGLPEQRMARWLRAHYAERRVGRWEVFLPRRS